MWHQPEEGLVNAAVPCSDWEQNMCGTSTGGALSHIPGGGDAGVDQQLTLRAVCSSTDIPARYRHRSRGSCRGSANAADMAVGVATCPGLVRPYESSWLPSTAACSHQSHPLSRDAFHRFAKLCTLLCRACLVRGVTQALQCSIRRLTVVECVRPPCEHVPVVHEEEVRQVGHLLVRQPRDVLPALHVLGGAHLHACMHTAVGHP